MYFRSSFHSHFTFNYTYFQHWHINRIVHSVAHHNLNNFGQQSFEMILGQRQIFYPTLFVQASPFMPQYVIQQQPELGLPQMVNFNPQVGGPFGPQMMFPTQGNQLPPMLYANAQQEQPGAPQDPNNPNNPQQPHNPAQVGYCTISDQSVGLCMFSHKFIEIPMFSMDTNDKRLPSIY